ncbi:MAG: exodeoxyribonuclease VII large subunit, partial [Bacillota bacterium]
MEPEVFSVSEVTDYIKRLLSRDHSLSDLWIKGEISNFYHHNSGHMYFTIKDRDAQISAVMFKGNNRNLKMDPEEGMEITAHGYVDVYKPRGEYQFYVQEMKPGGKGALYQAFEELKQRLGKEGLFDPEHKQEIPALPGRIGVVTSPDGAAIRDIISVAERRFDNVSLLIVPSLVQGERAAGQIVEGIEYLNSRKEEFDLIIVSRGGGSIEDLWPFNEEEVARTIYRSELPVISGVGHETDFTIVDFVSDLRAPTPSAAAEMAVSSRLELEKELKNLSSRLGRTMDNTLK